MKVRIITIFLSLLILFVSTSNATELRENERILVNELIDLFKAKDIDGIADKVVYPLKRREPITPVLNRDELLIRFDEIFDEVLIETIHSSDSSEWEAMGYRGIMFDAGLVWLDYSGKIIAVNYQSKAEETLKLKYLTAFDKPIGEELAYGIENKKFVTSEGPIRNGCFGSLQTGLNGDNVIAAVFLKDASFRGCINSNSPPGGDEENITYAIDESLGDHVYKLTVCELLPEGSLNVTCDNIIVEFTNRKYSSEGVAYEVLAVEKIGIW